jgi:hypothetical protein
MSITEAYGLEFARGLRSVPGYTQSLCNACRGACGEQPDDQCLISAWAAYIRAAEEDGHEAFEAGRCCAMARLGEVDELRNITVPNNLPKLPCVSNTL